MTSIPSPGAIIIDETPGKIDELADLCVLWKKYRDKGRTSGGIRNAIMQLCCEAISADELSGVKMGDEIAQWMKGSEKDTECL